MSTTDVAKVEPKIGSLVSFTLTANLVDITGAETGGYLRITLCGFGPVVPLINANFMVASAGIPLLVGPQVGATPLSVSLFTNAAITPAGTFYEIAVLDANKNVIQCGNYQFNTPNVTVDLSGATQIIPPYGFALGGLQYAHCTGAIPGTVYTAPGTVIAASYNGVFMVAGQAAPVLSYTATGNVITLNFNTQVGDRGIDALCVVV
jgi:hypothetical protein